MRGGLNSVLSAGIAAIVLTAGCATTLSSDTQSTSISPVSPNAHKMGVSPMGVSFAAAATAQRPPESYANVEAALENADMAAFMLQTRKSYEDKANSGAWGFAAVDMLLASQTSEALDVIDAMPGRGQWTVMSANYLRPWVMAANEQEDAALKAFDGLALQMPNHLYRGHRALFLEGLGRYDDALEIYSRGPKAFDRPDDEEESSPETFTRYIVYSTERLLALRHAELLIKLDRTEEAVSIYNALLEAHENDAYTRHKLTSIDDDDWEKPAFVTLETALAAALNDQAALLEERQMVAGVVLAKGAEAPFNHFVSALRQSALLLDPLNSSVRDSEARHLYAHGYFSAAAELALQTVTNSDEEKAGLMLRAAESHLEAGNVERMNELIATSLKLSGDVYGPLMAADLWVRSGQSEEAEDLLLDTLKRKDLELSEEDQSFAMMGLADARMQHGDVKGAQKAARNAVGFVDSTATQGFLASLLTETSDTRDEGLEIYADLFEQSPDDAGIMNNYGYSLVDGPRNTAELDRGYRLLRRANRITPFEPNLLDSLGWAYYQYGEYERAKTLVEQAMELYKPFSNWELHAHLGDIYWRLGRQQDAMTQWQKSLNARPPRKETAELQDRLQNGLNLPEPQKRAPPFVPTEEAPEPTQDI